jgi:hypothetical protein
MTAMLSIGPKHYCLVIRLVILMFSGKEKIIYLAALNDGYR